MGGVYDRYPITNFDVHYYLQALLRTQDPSTFLLSILHHEGLHRIHDELEQSKTKKPILPGQNRHLPLPYQRRLVQQKSSLLQKQPIRKFLHHRLRDIQHPY